jgi:Domain of unknown function (DUF4157)
LRAGDGLPAELRAALAEVFGAEPGEVDGVEIVERSGYARLHFGARATTRRNRILLRGTAAEFSADPELVLHEYYHVLRQWNRGRLSIAAYLLEWLRRGYWRNRYEHQARRFVRLRLDAFVELSGLRGRRVSSPAAGSLPASGRPGGRAAPPR